MAEFSAYCGQVLNGGSRGFLTVKIKILLIKSLDLFIAEMNFIWVSREPLKNVGGEALARRIWLGAPGKKSGVYTQ